MTRGIAVIRVSSMNQQIVGQASSLSPRASCPRRDPGLEAPETGWKPVLLLLSRSWSQWALILAFGFSHPTFAGDGWFPFDPKPDTFADSPIDLRFLNEKFAGEHGFIEAKDGHFIHAANGQPVRFWAVNGPPSDAKDRAALR